MMPPRTILSTDTADIMKPGHVVEVDHETADAFGAFEETAISEEDADESTIDLPEADDGAE